jgi:hypothetical protein
MVARVLARIPRKLDPIRTWSEPIDDRTFAFSALFTKQHGFHVYGFSAFIIVDRDEVYRLGRSHWRDVARRHFDERLKQHADYHGPFLAYFGDAGHFA